MAISLTEQNQILKIVAGMFNAAPGGAILSDLAQAVESGTSMAQLADMLADTTQFKNDIMGGKVTAEQQAAVLMNNFGVTPDGVAGSPATLAEAFFVGQIDAGVGLGAIVLQAVQFLETTTNVAYAPYAALLNNKALVAGIHAQSYNISSVAEGQAVLAGVSSEGPSTIEEANTFLAELGGVVGTVFTLTQRADNLAGNSQDNIFMAPVTQNETGSGELANTFETGDVLNGMGGRNILQADLIATGTIQDAVNTAPISATTSNIQEVYLRAQMPNQQNTVDAENMANVEQWWSVNSRSNITIEDIRTPTEDTTFGMRLTDPALSSFNNYFNALFLEGAQSSESDLTVSIQEITDGQAPSVTELANITVREINFDLNGESFTLDTEDMRAANTWAELEVAIAEALAADEALANLTVTHTGNGFFVISDTSGGIFTVQDGEALIFGAAADIDVRNRVEVGRITDEGPTTTNVVLDGAGNGSQGGMLNIGAMSGLRGVELFEVNVDRDSHLTSMTSSNQIGSPVLVENQFLEVVNLRSIGAEGDLTVGARLPSVDNRVATTGLVNVREVNGEDFAGSLNLGISLNNNTLGRYLDPSSEVVNFVYTGGAQDDLFNVSVAQAVSSDQDFAMQIDLGAGDDRLIINVPTVSQVSVDGGTGENSIVVSQSHGTNAANTFGEFANFQTYEVEGNGAAVADNTAHDFTSMPGVENVIIATDGDNTGNNAASNPLGLGALSTGVLTSLGDNTRLINMEADQSVTVSGKNQTAGNNSTNSQFFGSIQLTNDQGVDRTVALDNTARLSNAAVRETAVVLGVSNGTAKSGVLNVSELIIDSAANLSGTFSSVRNVTIESNGDRNVSNLVQEFYGRDVQSLNLTGTQDLTINVRQIADQASVAGVNTSTSVQIDATGLTGGLNLAVAGNMLNNFGTTPPTPAQTDTIRGTVGDNDTVMFYGALNAGNAVTATGIEKVQLGSYGAAGPGGAVLSTGTTVVALGDQNTLFGDAVFANNNAEGILNATNLGVSNFAIAAAGGLGLSLTNLSGGASIDLGDANTNQFGNRVVSQQLVEQINLQSSALTAATTASTLDINRLNVIATGTTSNINVGDSVLAAIANTGGFRTINLDVARDAALIATAADINNIDLDVGSQARTLNLTGGVEGRANDNVAANAAIAASGEVQTISFAGITLDAAGNIVVPGDVPANDVTVAIAPADIGNSAQIAIDVAAGLNGQDLFGTGNNITAVAVGESVRVTFDAVDGDVALIGALTADVAFVGGTPEVTEIAKPAAAVAAVAQVADIVDLTAGGNVLTNNLETIDLSDYNGQVTLSMQLGALGADQTDVNFVMSNYSANITLNNGGGGAGAFANINHNSTFSFTEAGTTTTPTQWVINNIVNGTAGNVNDTTFFDLTGLGLANFPQVDVLYVNDGDVVFDLYGNDLAAGSAVIRSETQGNTGSETWEIIVNTADGVALTGIPGGNGLDSTNFFS